MSALSSCLYHGEVGHRRIQPLAHGLSYRVYNLFADIDELPALSKRLKCFSYNRFNLFSIDDRLHGPGDGTSIADAIWPIARAAPVAHPIARIFMFCYPRVLGYAFNPLTVYYGFDADEQLRLTIYEVNNTFGERHTYAVPVGQGASPSASKMMHVSPFNLVEGRYRFRAEPPGETLRLGIALTTDEGPCLNAWFTGERRELSDTNLLRSFVSLPLLPLRVVGGIHWEALKLWRKGLPIRRKPAPPASPLTFTPPPTGR
jgi:uncharacterized protein